MKIRLFGELRNIAGEAAYDASGATIHEALANVCDSNETLLDAIFIEDRLRPYIRVMLNGLDCELMQGLETVVSDNDQIAVFPPLAGG